MTVIADLTNIDSMRSNTTLALGVLFCSLAFGCGSSGSGGGGGATGSGGSGATGGAAGTGGSAGAIPAGACPNPGGLFADYVSDKGYRCKPGDLPIYDIEVCNAGSWEPAMTCTCEVTSSISGGVDPSQCFDIDIKDVARCQYAADYCYQCDPVSGCKAN